MADLILSIMQQENADVGGLLQPFLDQFEEMERIKVELRPMSWSNGQEDLLRILHRSAKLLEDLDRVRHPALKRINGVDQQQAVVRIDFGIGAEGVEFAAAKGDKGLHHTVGMGALGRIAKHMGNPGI